MNQVSGFVGLFSKSKDGVLNTDYGCYDYYRKGSDIILPVMIITNLFYVTRQRKNLTIEHLSEKIPNFFLQNYIFWDIKNHTIRENRHLDMREGERLHIIHIKILVRIINDFS